ncbi:hypothetical protein BsWGS_17122 [Bradybaena similaris]
MRRFTFLWGALLFTVTIVSLYMMLDTMSSYPKSGSVDNLQLLESKLTKVEHDLEINKNVVRNIRKEISDLLKRGPEGIERLKELFGNVSMDLNPIIQQVQTAASRKEEPYQVAQIYPGLKTPENECKWVGKASSNADINIHQVVAEIPFDNPDGGAWKQGWPVTYEPTRWTAKDKLKIILVPHTHCDPGWIKTISDYYHTQVKKILDNFVPKLEQTPKYKFMFSEITYFSWWWSEISPSMKDRVRRLISSNQFEISTGGWVMTDEANAHYFAMLDQLIEGHQWLNNTLGYIPQSGWAVDPFGYSSTMAYLLKRSDFKSMLIQRVHYSLKKYLSQKTNLEFMWRQHWDAEASTDIFTHLMPFYSYDIPHTCGPEPAICCQFDFKRLPGSSYRCPWNIDPKTITNDNIAERSMTILDQWKKKATLYKTNVLLVPLGDDFRYMQADEFDLQFGNYEKIFQYLDEHPDLGAQAEFGTLSDYFNALYKETGTVPGQRPPNIPSLSGDFFSYADRDDHYWTGYFTSRPLQKNLDRSLEHNLRSAEIIFSLAYAEARKHSAANFPSKPFMEKLVEARRALGLFQHHDAITGTAKDFVVIDYGNRLLQALHETKTIVVECSTFLLAEKKAEYAWTPGASVFNMDELRSSHESLPTRPVLEVTEIPKPVLLYNSLAHHRTEVVKLWTNWPYVEVRDTDGVAIHSQVEPFWSSTEATDKGIFKVSFLADVPGLGIKKYTIRKVEKGSDTRNHLVSVVILNSDLTVAINEDLFSVTRSNSESDFNLDTNFLSASFSSRGLLKSVKSLVSGQTFKSQMDFIQYGTVRALDKSGAYLFLPDGDATPLLNTKPSMVRIIKGPITSEVHVITQYVQQVVRLHNSPGTDGSSVDVYNIVDIRNTANKEVGMRLHTDVDNNQQIFYSDLNGFQMQQRKYYRKLTLQGNVYPMPTMAYLQDKNKRVSILSSQATGVANLVQGALDVMFDRRLNQDDNRGLGQGVLDNHPTPSRFRILFESRTLDVENPNPETSFPSLLGQLSSLALIHPIFVMPRSSAGKEPSLSSSISLLTQSFPCELHLLNLRTLQNSDDMPELQYVPKESSLLLLRHLPSDCSFTSPSLSCTPGDGKVVLSDMFFTAGIKKSVETTLTMNKVLAEVPPSSALRVPPMEIMAVRIEFS